MITFSKLGKFGRLGNQMFQVASVMGYAHKHKVNYFLPNWSYSKSFDYQFNQQPRKCQFVHREPDFTYSTIPYKSSLDLEGYFQSEKYFEGLDMKEIFKPSKEIETYINEKYGEVLKGETVSIHVRRGDYLNLSDYHFNLSLEYYNSSISFFRDMPVNWIVFSDDVGWCRENFRMDRTHFVEGNLDVVDMFLMSKCKHNIIANSSFSWWASYLNRNPDKKVIAPKNWFGPLMNKGVEDLYLNNWILV
jgi:hypothetical protein